MRRWPQVPADIVDRLSTLYAATASACRGPWPNDPVLGDAARPIAVTHAEVAFTCARDGR